jgi:murein DD-endopeptidase MepM/ murein hydrolase activator NlpD
MMNDRVLSIKYKVLGIYAIKILAVSLILHTSFFIPHTIIVSAQTAEELQAKIDQRNVDIKNLEKEMAKYQAQIDDLSSQANTLSGTIKSLQLTQKKLETNITVTQDKISAKNFEIQQLGSQIVTKQSNISDDRRVVSQSFNQLNQLGQKGISDIILGSNSISDALNTLEDLSVVQKNIFTRISSLNKDKSQLEVNKTASEKAKAELVSLNQQLGDQRKVVLATVAEQNALLKQTNKSEAQYQKTLSQRTAQKVVFEKELFNYESQLKLSVDFSKLPTRGSGILSWPLANVFITQLFGVTSDSQRLYASGSHGGIDLRATRGTPVKASLSGIVTDLEKVNQKAGCQYGYWVLIRHSNGLSTLYGHLSVVSVNVGQALSTGDILGYSGNTGYSEGPHLHFGVYATSGIKVVSSEALNSATNCRGIRTVAADPKAYLDPMAYLSAQ